MMIRAGAYASILSAILIIPMGVVSYLAGARSDIVGIIPAALAGTLISVMLSVLIAWAFKVLGDHTKNRFLSIMSIVSLVFSAIFTVNAVLGVIFPALESLAVSLIAIILCGVNSLLFGIAILPLKKQFGGIATATAVIEIIVGGTFVTVILSPFGLLLIIPLLIVQAILLFRASKKFEKAL